jgi:ribosomal protein S12 methylthiotransferase accessory factor
MSLATCRHTGSPAPQAFFSAAAHPQPAEAIRSAVVEVAVNVVISVDLARARPDRYRRGYLRTLLADPYRITTPDEHVALYSLPETRSRYDFLDAHGDAAQPWQRRWPDAPPRVDDLAGYLTALVDRVVVAGMDVIVVDQSDPRLRERLGLHAAKVIVPGAVPLVFGHGYRRTRGLPRLLDVPVRLGRLPSRPDYDSLPLDPHPFP